MGGYPAPGGMPGMAPGVGMGGATAGGITINMQIQLRSVRTGQLLHTRRGLKYRHPGSSGQDEVSTTAMPSAETVWTVLPPWDRMRNPKGMQQEPARPVNEHQEFRLLNQSSLTALHSHNLHSPTTKQQEVTGFDAADDNDNWKITKV